MKFVRTSFTHIRSLGILFLCLSSTAAYAQTTAKTQLTELESKIGRTASSSEGKVFFTKSHASDWSCATCHGAPPIKDGEHASTGKKIKPLAPAFNPDAFTSQKRTDKWFKRNCNDVLDRACTDQEKANVLAYLLSLKP